MIREEIKNGTKTSLRGSHLQKAQEGLDSMRKLLKGNFGTLPDSDRKIVFEIVKDLMKGTGFKW